MQLAVTDSSHSPGSPIGSSIIVLHTATGYCVLLLLATYDYLKSYVLLAHRSGLVLSGYGRHTNGPASVGISVHLVKVSFQLHNFGQQSEFKPVGFWQYQISLKFLMIQFTDLLEFPMRLFSTLLRILISSGFEGSPRWAFRISSIRVRITRAFTMPWAACT